MNAIQNSTLTMNGGALALNVPGTNTYNLGGLAGTSNIAALGANVLSVGSNNTNTAYSGAITGSGGSSSRLAPRRSP